MYFGFENISLSYGKKEILKNISIEIPKGKLTTLIGKNGSGKSTLIKALNKTIKPKSGQIYIEGKAINTYKQIDLAKKLAILPQVHSAPGDIDIKTLVSYGRSPYLKFGKSLSALDEEIIEKALVETGLEKIQMQKLKESSGGEQKRAWIAMTIAQNSEILVLDEPTTYLDISYQFEIMELLKNLQESRKLTLLLVLHDLNLASRYSDNIIALKDKKIYGCGQPNNFLCKDVIGDVYNIDVDIHKDIDTNTNYFIARNQIKK